MTDQKTKQQIIASELREAGFQVDSFANGLLVSLKNRKVSTMEVSTALMDKLEIEVPVQSTSQGVFIGTVT